MFGVAMPEDTLRTLSASLWDLRSLCEQQLRAITDAQRLAHQFQKQTAPQAAMKQLMVSEFNTVRRVIALASRVGRGMRGPADAASGRGRTRPTDLEPDHK
jgi:hypothetical protein